MAATPITAASTIIKTWGNGVVEKWIYNDSTNPVLKAASETFKIPVRNIQGRILEVAFDSLSDNCDVFLSEKDSQIATSYLTPLYFQSINLGYSPELSAPRYYVNQDSTQTAHLYFTIDNTNGVTATTGDWNLSITFERY